jgi:hypothetical protein
VYKISLELRFVLQVFFRYWVAVLEPFMSLFKCVWNNGETQLAGDLVPLIDDVVPKFGISFYLNSCPHTWIHLFKTSWQIFYLSTTPLLWFPHGIWISSRDLWRHIFVMSFLHRVYDVIFLWRHFFAGFMTSYFCDVISSKGLWRHIFVTSFLRRVYDVIFLWHHFFTGFMTSSSYRLLDKIPARKRMKSRRAV